MNTKIISLTYSTTTSINNSKITNRLQNRKQVVDEFDWNNVEHRRHSSHSVLNIKKILTAFQQKWKLPIKSPRPKKYDLGTPYNFCNEFLNDFVFGKMTQEGVNRYSEKALYRLKDEDLQGYEKLYEDFDEFECFGVDAHIVPNFYFKDSAARGVKSFKIFVGINKKEIMKNKKKETVLKWEIRITPDFIKLSKSAKNDTNIVEDKLKTKKRIAKNQNNPLQGGLPGLGKQN